MKGGGGLAKYLSSNSPHLTFYEINLIITENKFDENSHLLIVLSKADLASL